MKLGLIALLFISSFTFAQEKNEIIVGKNYYGNTINESEICDLVAFATRPEVSMAIESIVRRSGLKQNFYVMECPNTDNCFAATRNGERLIVYDSKFINRLNNVTKTDWGALSILAHEIGHHLQGHTIKPGGSEHDKELEADEFSGFVMYQMGATLKEAQAAIFSLTTEYTTSTHPPRSKRLKSIERGFLNAKELYPELNIKNKTLEVFPEISVENTKPNTPNKEIILVSDKDALPKTPEIIKLTGCISGTCTEGYGVSVNSRTSEKYDGQWHMGKRHGQGKEYYKDGKIKYEGQFANSLYNGQGTFYFKNGDKYQGGFYTGKLHGSKSTYTYKNGDKLIVDFILGKRDGKAKVIYYGGVEGVKFFRDDVEIR